MGLLHLGNRLPEKYPHLAAHRQHPSLKRTRNVARPAGHSDGRARELRTCSAASWDCSSSTAACSSDISEAAQAGRGG